MVVAIGGGGVGVTGMSLYCVAVSSRLDGGLGDRHQQNPSTGSGQAVNYTLDLNAGLTQVLSDGMNTYLYGNGRISQHTTQTEYFLGDALGSVRQLADSAGVVTLTQSYVPYGNVANSTGISQTSYGFTSEFTDPNGLVYLRARYYAPTDGRFISRDTWNGDYNRPLSLNRWGYVEGNPINAIDPSGYITERESERAELILAKLNTSYNVQIKRDWGYLNEFIDVSSYPVDASLGCEWINGNWRTLDELEWTLEAVKDMAHKAFGSAGHFRTMMRWKPIRVYRVPTELFLGGGAYSINNVILPNNAFNSTTREEWAKGQVVHELAHVWDFRQNPPFRLSKEMAAKTKSFKEICTKGDYIEYCYLIYDPSGNQASPTEYGQTNPREDFAESFKIFLYPDMIAGSLGSIRTQYIEDKIEDILNP